MISLNFKPIFQLLQQVFMLRPDEQVTTMSKMRDGHDKQMMMILVQVTSMMMTENDEAAPRKN